MEQERHSAHTRQASMLAACLMLTVGAACADTWTHDSIDGAVTVLALPGGQATLARDGADWQARTITYTSTDGNTTTITRDYGPSGHKAVEVENGTVRQHVYGAGLSPLLWIEGDGSLSYQVGMDTISVDTAGSATVAHRIADIKRSTVAVLDARALPQQRVSYGTLGQSRREQESDNAYTDTAQRHGYEDLRVWRLDSANQLLDNRARVYFPVAGRFLALDAAVQARAYEARGNNWIAYADYDGNLRELINAVKNNRRIVLAIGEDHRFVEGVIFLMMLVRALQAEDIPVQIFSEENLLFTLTGEPNHRVVRLGLERDMTELLASGRLLHMTQEDAPILRRHEEYEIRTQLIAQLKSQPGQNWPNLAQVDEFKFARSSHWEISRLKWLAAQKNAVAILFTGAAHLLENPDKGVLYYRRPIDGMTYRHTVLGNMSVMQPLYTYDLVNHHELVGFIPSMVINGERLFVDSRRPYLKLVVPLSMHYLVQGHAVIFSTPRYIIFAPRTITEIQPSLNRVFGLNNQQLREDTREEKQDDAGPPHVNGQQPVVQPVANQGGQNAPEHGGLEVIDAALKEAMPEKKGCCHCCLVQ